jgi:hypothetical protein
VGTCEGRTLRRLDTQIAAIDRDRLGPLQSGSLHLAERKPGESYWEEATQREVKRLRDVVDNLKGIRRALSEQTGL